MPKKTSLFRKIMYRLLFVAILVLIVWANVNRFKHNLYANYEKVVDYGRVRETEESVHPVMAAIFYDDKGIEHKQISTYYNHIDNYKRKNVKIVIVPKDLTADSLLIVKKLYAEIYKYNQIKKIALISDGKSDVYAHADMIKRVMNTNRIEKAVLTEDNLAAESLFDRYLRKNHNVIVVLADLSTGFDAENTDFLLEEAVYFAQKYFYRLEVFDVIDTKIAQAIEKDYATLLSLTQNKDEPLVFKQIRNIALFVSHYKSELLQYFKMNLNMNAEIIWPEKTEQNFRLFDRGWLNVRLYDEEMQEIFVRKALKDKGIIVSLIEIANKASLKIDIRKIKYIRINLLTDVEEINKAKDTLLINYLDQDDGVMIEYDSHRALIIADERPDEPAELERMLRRRVGVSMEEPEENIRFYKFKSVEIEDEN